MFMFLCFVANQEEGVAGTLHVVVAEGNYCSTWRAFSQLFYAIPLMLTVYVVLAIFFLVLQHFSFTLEATLIPF